MIGGESHITEPIRSLNDSGGQAHLDVPLDVAVEEEDTRVGGDVAQHGERVGHDGEGIALRRLGVVVHVTTRPSTGATAGTVKNLELVAVKVERVDGAIAIVDDNLDDVAVVDNERIDKTVDTSVGIGSPRSGNTVEGGNLLGNIRLIVEAGTFGRDELAVKSSRRRGYILPRQAVGIYAEVEVQDNGLGWWPVCASAVESREVRVINWAPTVDLVDCGGRLRGIHDEISCEVVRPDKLAGVAGIVPVHVQRKKEREVAVVSVDCLDEEVVTLSRGDTQLVCLGF